MTFRFRSRADAVRYLHHRAEGTPLGVYHAEKEPSWRAKKRKIIPSQLTGDLLTRLGLLVAIFVGQPKRHIRHGLARLVDH